MKEYLHCSEDKFLFENFSIGLHIHLHLQFLAGGGSKK